MRPKITIGIPTYNRAQMVKRAIHAALGQSLDQIEVVVCDNGSVDDTPRILRELEGRIRHFRIERNEGSMPAFRRVVEEAAGEYFIFLQDDDVIHRDMAKRAYAQFEKDREIVGYMCALSMSRSVECWHMPTLFGPPFRLDWMSNSVRTMDGKLMAPLCFCGAMSFPPAMAYQTEKLRGTFPYWHPECDNLMECVVFAAAVLDGKVAIDPWVGAVHFLHEAQYHLYVNSELKATRREQKERMASSVQRMMQGWDESWKAPLLELFLEIPVDSRVVWLQKLKEFDSPSVLVATREVLKESIERSGGSSSCPAKVVSIKDYFRQVTPPIVWQGLQSLKRRRHA